ncbi:MAG: T9SS type A sorting domain-containing protein [Bacteroidetes bacterium]|nr:T9SS type A sorting domain-containing protein [Bacteroidota bacterium]
MKKIIITFLLLTSVPSFAQMTPMWKNSFGVPTYSAGYAKSSVCDSLGNIYVLDDVVNYNSLENTCHEPVLRKISAQGESLWFIQFANIHCIDQAGFNLKIKDGFLYATYTKYDSGGGGAKFCVSKISLSGTIKWEKKLFGTYTNHYPIDKQFLFDNAGNILVSCRTDYRIWKLDINGNILDTTKTTVNGNIACYYTFKIYQDKIISIVWYSENNQQRFFLNCSNFDGTTLWTKEIFPYEFAQLLLGEDGSIYEHHRRYETLTGYFHSINKYNFLGNLLWSKETLAITQNQGNYSEFDDFPILINAKDGNLIFSNTAAVTLYSSQITSVVKKFSSVTGDSLWTFRLYSMYPYFSVATSLLQDSLGFIYAGSQIGFLQNYYTGNSYGIIKFSPDGNIVRKTFNDNFLDGMFVPAYMNILPNNDLAVTGYYDTQALSYSQEVTMRYSQPLAIFENENLKIYKFSLYQNYPNPFNPNTVISFQLPVNSFVNIKVFNINGREVSELVNEKLSAGEYKIDFNGSLLPSGVYYYKMTTENFSETKKMILVK